MISVTGKSDTIRSLKGYHSLHNIISINLIVSYSSIDRTTVFVADGFGPKYAYLGNLHTILFRHGLGIASPPLLLTYVNNIIS